MEGVPLGAGRDAPAVDELLKQPEDVEAELADALEKVDVPLDVQAGHHRPQQEEPRVPHRGPLYLPRPLDAPVVPHLLVHPVDLGLEVAHGIRDPTPDELVDVADGPAGGVDRPALVRVVVAFVDLQVYALLYAGFLQEV